MVTIGNKSFNNGLVSGSLWARTDREDISKRRSGRSKQGI
jgi:hypothetical protein